MAIEPRRFTKNPLGKWLLPVLLAVPVANSEQISTVPDAQECSYIESLVSDIASGFSQIHSTSIKGKRHEQASGIPPGASGCEFDDQETLSCTWEYSKLATDDEMERRALDLGKEVLECIRQSRYRDSAWLLGNDNGQVFIETGSKVALIESRYLGKNASGRPFVEMMITVYKSLADWPVTRKWYDDRADAPKFRKLSASLRKKS
jgi:hypothetical protein